jgi:hypothetical protein
MKSHCMTPQGGCSCNDAETSACPKTGKFIDIQKPKVLCTLLGCTGTGSCEPKDCSIISKVTESNS